MMDMTTVLVIEDDDTLRLGISQVLKKNHFKVYEAGSGPKGIELFKRYRHDLVITDYRMEPMNGLEVLQEIKKITPETEVIMITAHGTPEIMLEAEKAGACEFIFKPFPMVEFEVRVNKAIRLIREREESIRDKSELQYLREELGVVPETTGMIGNSAEMKLIYQKIQNLKTIKFQESGQYC